MLQDSFAFSTFSFRQPKWRAPEALLTQTVVLLLGSVLWVFLYGWLSRYFWLHGIRLDQMGLTLIGSCILLGVGIALGWYRTIKYWQTPLASKQVSGPVALSQMLKLSPADFEAYVANALFANQGYIVHDTPHVKDGGIDILLENENGLRAIVQCKRYRGTVGVGTVRGLYGTMIHERVAYAYLVTTGRISGDARKWSEGKPISLIDGEMLERLVQRIFHD